MDLYGTLLEVIDLRSFSNLWYWIALAVVWSTASHWVLGVPWDMVLRAAREGGQAERDLAEIVRINLDRIFTALARSGLWLAGLAALVLTMLVMLGFGYGVQFAQAVFFIVFPMMLVGLLTIRTGARIRREGASGARLRQLMARHRVETQALGMATILVTVFYGMAQTLNVQLTMP